MVQATYKCKDRGDWFDSWKEKLEAVVEESRMKASLLLLHPLQKSCEWNTGATFVVSYWHKETSFFYSYHISCCECIPWQVSACWVKEISSRNDTYDWKASHQCQFHYEMLFRWLAERLQTHLHLAHFLAARLVSQLNLMKENMSEVYSYAAN